MKKDITYLVISDIHLGNKKNKTEDIIKNLDIYFEDYTPVSRFIELDILYIAGDLFDTLLSFNDQDITYIYIWLNKLFRFCLKNKIKLRILEGTPSHDWKQSFMSSFIHNEHYKELDFKYIDTLSIEHIKDLDIYVLYIPDEWSESSENTYLQVTNLLKEYKIDKVDTAIMHGMFEFQLPNVVSKTMKHNEYNYLSIVKHYINIGHDHGYSFFDRIIVEGSFDRLAHGEEDPKGGVLCNISDKSEDSFYFIENVNAKIFKTIELKNNDLDKSIIKIDKQVKNLKIDSYVRIKAEKNHPVFQAFEEIKLRYPEYNLSKLAKEDEVIIDKSIKNNLLEIKNITISKDNVVQLLSSRILAKHTLNNDQKNIMFSSLESLNAN